jgi:ATP-dependent DNA helicase RecG
VIDAGWQVALMALTELLAEQHFETVRPAAGAARRRDALTAAGRVVRVARRWTGWDGRIGLALGTHALIQETVGSTPRARDRR